jgi:pSer/pThr/pTyr-binding forkhead associated (FHA) protein
VLPSLDDTAPQEQPPVGQLVLSLDGEAVSETYLVPGRYIIGRTPDNDLHIDSKFVSRHHAQIVTTFEGSWVEDLNSTNGVFVRGKRVRRHRLAEGDVVKIGRHELAYSRATRAEALAGAKVDSDESEDSDEPEHEASVAAGDEQRA